jgi:hypothetical protein
MADAERSATLSISLSLHNIYGRPETCQQSPISCSCPIRPFWRLFVSFNGPTYYVRQPTIPVTNPNDADEM